MNIHSELTTINSTLEDVAARITALVEGDGSQLPTDHYNELVAAERAVGGLVRRLTRLASKVR